VLTVLRALGANDERIVEYFRGISAGRKRSRGKDQFSIDIPEGLKINAANFVKSIELQLWSRLARLSWQTLGEAREFVHSLNLKNVTEWRKYCNGYLRYKVKKPADIPANPDTAYKHYGWVSWGDWLGTGTVSYQLRTWREFHQARTFVRRLGLKDVSEWRKYGKGDLPEKIKLPQDIPIAPWVVYRTKGWISLGDWLGTGAVASSRRQYRPFPEARKFVHQLKLKSNSEWLKYCKGKLPNQAKLPEDIPATPERTYRHRGWVGLGGTGTVAPRLRKYRPSLKPVRSPMDLH